MNISARCLRNFSRYTNPKVVPALPHVRRSVIYGDANDHNILVADSWPQPRQAKAVIDFGDMHYGITVSEPAIAAAYAILGKYDPLPAAQAIISGYHRAHPLEESEIKILFPLMAMRLAVSVVLSSQRKQLRPDDPYMTISEAPAWQALERLDKINPGFAHYAFRDACNFPPEPKSAAIGDYLKQKSAHAVPILGVDQRTVPVHVFDLSVSSSFLGADPGNAECATLAAAIDAELRRAKATIGVGRYNEPRLLYTSPLFQTTSNPTDEQRTIHLGLDLFVTPGTPVHAPLPATVEAFANNTAALDYGPVIILKHATASGQTFYTLYGHLSMKSLEHLKIGQQIKQGEKFATIGSAQENGGWPPHLHFQIVTDLLDLGTNFPGVASASQRNIWTSLSPDPNLLLAIPEEYFPPREPTREQTLIARKETLGANLSLSYDRPLKIVRGWRQYLYDDIGPSLPRCLQQRAVGGPQPPASSARRARATRSAEHQHALSARSTPRAMPNG